MTTAAHSLYLGIDNGRFNAEVYGTHLTNSRGTLDYANNGGANQTGLARFVTPRTIGVELGVNF